MNIFLKNINCIYNMNSVIVFSVTVPAYKAQFLAECIDNILAQSYKYL